MDKRSLWQKIDDTQNQLMELCRGMIRIPSENPPGHVEEMASFLMKFLKAHGIPYEVVRPVPERPCILARIGNPDGKRILFNGHMDVVPAGDREKWDVDPYGGEIYEGKIHGRGASDMKCGLGAVLYSMALLKESGAALSGEMALMIVPDEETGGEYGTGWLFEHGYGKADWGIVAEPTGYDNIEVGQKGQVNLDVIASGRSAHGRLSPDVGENAIDRLIRFLPELYALRELHGIYDGEVGPVMEFSKEIIKGIQKVPGVETVMDHVTVNLGTITGGSKRNMVADSARAEVDIRVPIGVAARTVTDKIQQIVRETEIPGISVEIHGARTGNYVSVKDSIVLAANRCAREVMGIDLIKAYQWASSDTRYFREAGISTIQYGPSNTEGIHTYNETANVEDVVRAAKMYTGIVMDLIGQQE